MIRIYVCNVGWLEAQNAQQLTALINEHPDINTDVKESLVHCVSLMQTGNQVGGNHPVASRHPSREGNKSGIEGN